MQTHTTERRRGAPRGSSSPIRSARTLASGLVLGAALGVLGAGVAGAGPHVPYRDPAQSGYIGMCNDKGQQITSGSVDAAPFAWRAVSSVPAPIGYGGPSRTAVLLAFQPIDGLAPSDWSGDQLTASARYSNPADPMAAATTADESLRQFMVEFAPKWDGIFQLRIYLGAANEQPYAVHYPALDIQVTGHTWRALDGGPVDCTAGKAESIESILLQGSTHSAVAKGSSKAAAGARTADASSTGSQLATVGVVLAAAVVVAAVLFLLHRRRRRAAAAASPTPTPSSGTEDDQRRVTAGSAPGGGGTR